MEQGIEKGLAQGLEQSLERGEGLRKGIHKSIERVVGVRFPTLSKLLKRKIAPIRDQEMLLQISVAMSTLESEQAARQYLPALKAEKKAEQ